MANYLYQGLLSNKAGPSPNIKLMTDAVNQGNVAKQQKKNLKEMCKDLGWQNKMKKDEIIQKLPHSLLQIFSSNQEHEIFKKYDFLRQIIQKYVAALNAQQLSMQQRLPMAPQMNLLYYPMMQPPQFQYQLLNNFLTPMTAGLRQQMAGPQIFLNEMPNVPQSTDSNTAFNYCPCKYHQSKYIRVQQYRRKEVHLGDVKCLNCENRVHVGCLGISERDKQTFECPQCILLKMDPLNPVVKPFGKLIMSWQHRLDRQNEMRVNFIVSPEDQTLIQLGNHAFEIRCIRLDGKYLSEITWPDTGELIINNHRVQEFKPLVQNSSLKKRKDEKYTTQDLSLLASQPVNYVQLKETVLENKSQYKICEDAVYLMLVCLVKKMTPLELINQIKNNKESHKTKEESIDQIKRQTQDNSEGEVQISSVTVSLKCQFDSMMIETPCRGRFCDHIQCFSLENIIKMTAQVTPRRWKCPICKQKIFVLMIDVYQKEIIESYRQKKLTVREITFDKDGNTIQEQHDKYVEGSEDDSDFPQAKPQPPQPQKNNQLIVLDEEEQNKKNPEEQPSDTVITNGATQNQPPVTPSVPFLANHLLQQVNQTALQQLQYPRSLLQQQAQQALQHQQMQMLYQQYQHYQKNQLKTSKEDLRKQEQFQSIQQQYALLTKIKDFVEKQEETKEAKLESMRNNLSHQAPHMTSNAKLSFSKWKSLKENGVQKMETEVPNKEKNYQKQKEKMIKIIKKQHYDLLRRNHTNVDYPVIQQLQSLKAANGQKSRPIIKINATMETYQNAQLQSALLSNKPPVQPQQTQADHLLKQFKEMIPPQHPANLLKSILQTQNQVPTPSPQGQGAPQQNQLQSQQQAAPPPQVPLQQKQDKAQEYITIDDE